VWETKQWKPRIVWITANHCNYNWNSQQKSSQFSVPASNHIEEIQSRLSGTLHSHDPWVWLRFLFRPHLRPTCLYFLIPDQGPWLKRLDLDLTWIMRRGRGWKAEPCVWPGQKNKLRRRQGRGTGGRVRLDFSGRGKRVKHGEYWWVFISGEAFRILYLLPSYNSEQFSQAHRHRSTPNRCGSYHIKVGPTSGNAHNRSFSHRKNVILPIHSWISCKVDNDYNYDIDNLFYHVEFEGRECVLVQAFARILHQVNVFVFYFFCLKLEVISKFLKFIVRIPSCY